jgi:hypothetical protein
VIWLAPLAFAVRRQSHPVAFLAGLAAFGAMGAFRLPPVDNLLRGLPVLDVTDNRRLTLWVAFGMTMLGGIGLDHLGQTFRLARGWVALWVVGAGCLAILAGMAHGFEPAVRARALAHYRQAATATPGADPAAYRERAERQVRQTLDFLPRYAALTAAELGALAALATALRKARQSPAWVAPALLGLTLVELGLFGSGLNPAIRRAWHHFEPPVIAMLRRGLPPEGRAVGLGEELPPNVLMRFGLSDLRNYDSVELASSLAWFDPLYQASPAARTSRRAVAWEGVIRARARLRESCVGAAVAAVAPPAGAFDRVEKAGRVWIAWLDAKPWVEAAVPGTAVDWNREPGRARILVRAPSPSRLTVRESWDPGWKALLDGQPVPVEPAGKSFLGVQVPPGQHQIILEYDPAEVRIGLAISGAALTAVILILTGIPRS